MWTIAAQRRRRNRCLAVKVLVLLVVGAGRSGAAAETINDVASSSSSSTSSSYSAVLNAAKGEDSAVFDRPAPMGDAFVAPIRPASCSNEEAVRDSLCRRKEDDHQEGDQFCRLDETLRSDNEEGSLEELDEPDSEAFDDEGRLDNNNPFKGANDEGSGGVDNDTEQWEGDDYYYYDNEDDGGTASSPKDSDGGDTSSATKDYSIMTVSDMWLHAFGCDDVFQTIRPIHNQSTWTFLRGVYIGVMMTSSLPGMHPVEPPVLSGSINNSTNNAERHHRTKLLHDHGSTIDRRAPLGSGFRKAVQARQTDDGKGRGVYAAEIIRKGELVWTATSATARFPSGALYRQFLAIIPPDLACDVLQWAYVQDVSHFHHDVSESNNNTNNDSHNSTCGHDVPCERTDPSPPDARGTPEPLLRVSVDLDEGSYMNSEDYEPNVGCLSPENEMASGNDDDHEDSSARVPTHCRQNFYALRDIHVGEELLCYYGDFAMSEGWAEFGL